MDTTVQMLEQRIAELEKQLKTLGSQQQKPNVNPEEMATFVKVSNQLGYDVIDECGVNECQPVIRFRGSPYFHPHIPFPVFHCYECKLRPLWCNRLQERCDAGP